MNPYPHATISGIRADVLWLPIRLYKICVPRGTIVQLEPSPRTLSMKNIVRNTLVVLAVCGLYVQVQAAAVAPWHMHPWVSAPIRTVVEAYLTNAD